MLSWTTLSAGDKGITETLREMRRLVDEATRDPAVVAVARRIAAPAGRAGRGQVQRLFEWVRSHVRFVRDPVGYELVSTPRRLLNEIAARGSTSEDCESMSALLATLVESIGFPTQFHVASVAPRRRAGDSEFQHVWIDALVDGRWIPLDPALRNPAFGRRATRTVTEAIYDATGETLRYLGFFEEIGAGLTTLVSSQTAQSVGGAIVGTATKYFEAEIQKDVLEAQRKLAEAQASALRAQTLARVGYVPTAGAPAPGAMTMNQWLPIVAIGAAALLFMGGGGRRR